MQGAYRIDKDTIVIDRELTQLDIFVRDFLTILNVDVLVKVMDRARFKALFADLLQHCFWCYQGDSADEVYPYIQEKDSIRFSRQEEMFPNMEIIPIDEKKKAQLYEYMHPQKMRVQNFEFKVPPIEFEILYKEMRLGSEKDIADAKHLRSIFAEMLDEAKFRKYKEVIEND